MSKTIFLEDADSMLLDRLREIKFDNVVKSSYAPKRVEKWYGFASNLQSIKEGRVEVSWVEDFPDWMEPARLKYFPEANSALVCKGYMPVSETSIDWHRDHGSFFNRVVMINFGRATFYVQDYDEGTEVHELRDSHVVDFDSKLLHKSIQNSNERFIITFRKVKTEFSRYKLF